jgi:hypothetical protein
MAMRARLFFVPNRRHASVARREVKSTLIGDLLGDVVGDDSSDTSGDGLPQTLSNSSGDVVSSATGNSLLGGDGDDTTNTLQDTPTDTNNVSDNNGVEPTSTGPLSPQPSQPSTPSSTPSGGTPSTASGTPTWVWYALGGVAVVGAVLLVRKGKRGGSSTHHTRAHG